MKFFPRSTLILGTNIEGQTRILGKPRYAYPPRPLVYPRQVWTQSIKTVDMFLLILTFDLIFTKIQQAQAVIVFYHYTKSDHDILKTVDERLQTNRQTNNMDFMLRMTSSHYQALVNQTESWAITPGSDCDRKKTP